MEPRFKQVTLKVEDVKPNPKNPRIDLRPGMPLYEKLKSSIEHFSYVDPIIWNKTTGMIVSGHQRFQVMKDLADAKNEPMKTVDVMQVEMTEAEQDSFMVAVNKITGLWDTEKLTALFKELSEEDLSYTGYDEFEIQALLDEDSDIANTGEYIDSENERKPVKYEERFEVVITAKDEAEQQKIYDKMISEGYTCRLSQ